MCSPDDFKVPKAKFCKRCLEGMKWFKGKRLGFRDESVNHSEPQKKKDSRIVKSACVHACACVHAQSCLTLATSWTIARKAPLSMGLSKQEYWSGFPLLLQGNLPNAVIEPRSPMSLALAGGFFTSEPPGKPKPVLKASQIRSIQYLFKC